jgi:hypothetical protein
MSIPVSVTGVVPLLKGIAAGLSVLIGLFRLYREARDVMGDDR